MSIRSPSALPAHLSSCSPADSEGVQRCPELFSRPLVASSDVAKKLVDLACGLPMAPSRNSCQGGFEQTEQKGTGRVNGSTWGHWGPPHGGRITLHGIPRGRQAWGMLRLLGPPSGCVTWDTSTSNVSS